LGILPIISRGIDFGFINTINLQLDLIRDGGLTIPKKKETMMENTSFTCSNPSCRKVFTRPLKADAQGSTRNKPYDACPYCLTEVVMVSSDPEPDGLRDLPKPATERFVETPPENDSPVEKQSQIADNAATCKHSFGYLSKRTGNEGIPDECMTCENIVQCMLKTIRG
jgi:hypothetical protein